jgi:bacillithiol biosynthesis deacetylase BshB1
MKLDLLAFAAHPDDVELFCGGTMIKLAQKGLQTGVVDLSRGELGSRGSAEIRNEEAAVSSKKMNLKYRANLKIPDGNIENNQGNRLKIIEEIRTTRPEFLIVPYWIDRHPDHENASRLIKESIFYAGLRKLETEHEAYRPEHIIYYYMHKVIEPVIIIDISAQFEDKIKLIEGFKSQFYDEHSKKADTYISSKEFWDFIKIRARYFGFQIGVEYGEPFFVEHPVKFDNLYKLFA